MKELDFTLLEQNVISCEKRFKAKKLTAIFCQTVGNLFFMLWAYIAFYGMLPKLFNNKPLQILKEIKFLKSFYKPFTSLAKELSLPSWTGIAFSIIACVLFAVILDLIFMAFSGLLVKKPNITLTGTAEDKANFLMTRIDNSQQGIYCKSKYKKIFSIVFFAITTATIIVISLKNKKAFNKELYEVIFIEILVFISYLILQQIYYSIIKGLFKNGQTPVYNSTKKELEDFIAEVNAEKKRIEMENKALEKQRKAEEKRIKEEENKKLAKELYEKAIANDEIDEELMKKAAELKNPDACLYIGKELMKDYYSDKFTKKEKEKFLNKAQMILFNARNLNAEGKFLHISASVLNDSKNLSEWKNDLTALRKIQKSGELPECYTENLENVLHIVVKTIDEMEENAATKNNYTPDPPKATPTYTPPTPKEIHNCRDCKYYMTDVDLPFPVCTLHQFHFENDFTACDDFTHK